MSTEVQNTTSSQHDAKLPVNRRYFKCRFFKGQVLTYKIFCVDNEKQAREEFSKDQRCKKYNLLEVVEI